MKIAFYDRYSSDNQREASIEDQRRIVSRWAERCGHTLVTAFTDYATSAASLKMLDGLRAAIHAAGAIPAPFEALVVDQLSRLSRDIGDTDAIVKKLNFFGIRIIAVQDGIDTADETTKISVTVKSLVNEIYPGRPTEDHQARTGRSVPEGLLHRGPHEAGWQGEHGAPRLGGRFVFQRRLEDALDAPHVDGVEGERPGAGRVHPGRAEPLTEPQELLGLPEPRPEERPAQEHAQELPHGGPERRPLLDAAVRGPERVGGQGRRVVGVIGGPVPGRLGGSLGGMRLDEGAPVVEPDEPGVAAHLKTLPHVAGRHRVERPAELDVVIGVDGGLGPRRAVEGCRGERQQPRPLDRLEDEAGHLARRAVEPRPRMLPAPEEGPGLHLGQVAEALASEEVLAGKRNPPLHLGLPGRLRRHGRVRDEAPVLGVLQEDPAERGGIPVGPRDRRRQVVEHEPMRDPAEEVPGHLQPVEERGEVLAEAHGQAGVAAVAEGHQEAGDAAPRARRGIRPPPEDPEVHLGRLPGRWLCHADGDRRGPEAAVGLRKPIERTVRDRDPLGPESPGHLVQAQPLGEPRLDLRLVRRRAYPASLGGRSLGARSVPRIVGRRVAGRRHSPRGCTSPRSSGRGRCPGQSPGAHPRRRTVARLRAPRSSTAPDRPWALLSLVLRRSTIARAAPEVGECSWKTTGGIFLKNWRF